MLEKPIVPLILYANRAGMSCIVFFSLCKLIVPHAANTEL